MTFFFPFFFLMYKFVIPLLFYAVPMWLAGMGWLVEFTLGREFIFFSPELGSDISHCINASSEIRCSY